MIGFSKYQELYGSQPAKIDIEAKAKALQESLKKPKKLKSKKGKETTGQEEVEIVSISQLFIFILLSHECS